MVATSERHNDGPEARELQTRVREAEMDRKRAGRSVSWAGSVRARPRARQQPSVVGSIFFSKSIYIYKKSISNLYFFSKELC